MNLSPVQKVIIIFFLTLLAAIICLPKKFPISIHLGPINIEKEVVRPDINFTRGKFSIKKSFDLVLGLDLAGGSHLVFEADVKDLTPDQKTRALDSLRNIMERRVNLFGVSEPNVQTSSFEGKDRIIVELPGVHDTKEAVELIGQTAQLVFAELGEEVEGGAVINPTDLTGADLQEARVNFDQTTGKPTVSILFTTDGVKKFAEITKKNIGKPVAILLDGMIISAPIVQEEITGGQAQISGNFTVEEAEKLTIQLNAGALPVPVELVEQRTVGATLGAESIEKSVKAGAVGLSMVLLFMILAYGRLGLIADIALVVFGILTLALYKLIPVVLTLPGIAGFLLSTGMAVDSNILIFERFKEEQ